MYKAICKADFDRVLKAQKHIDSNPSFKKSVYLDRIEDRLLAPQEIKGLGFYEIYGIWFDKEISKILQESVPCSSRIVYLNEKPEKLFPGTHEVKVVDKLAWLYFWVAQGYPRGLVVLAENEEANNKAAELAGCAPWRWDGLLNL